MTGLYVSVLLVVLVGNLLVLYGALTANPEDRALWRRWMNQVMDRVKR